MLFMLCFIIICFGVYLFSVFLQFLHKNSFVLVFSGFVSVGFVILLFIALFDLAVVLFVLACLFVYLFVTDCFGFSFCLVVFNSVAISCSDNRRLCLFDILVYFVGDWLFVCCYFNCLFVWLVYVLRLLLCAVDCFLVYLFWGFCALFSVWTVVW